MAGLSASVAFAADADPCRDTPEWCDPKMIAMKLEDGAGTLNIRLEEGGQVFWRRLGWMGKLAVQAERQPGGVLKVTVSLPLSDGSLRPLKTIVLKKGEAVIIVPGKDVPANYFGPPDKPVKFIAD